MPPAHPQALHPASDELPRAGFPWAMLWAIVLLASVDVALRVADPRKVIPYELGKREHPAVAAYIDAFGPADVCFVGSSHTREGILAGEIEKRCNRAGLSVQVANYGLSGARADGDEQVVRRLLEYDRKPLLILVGTAPSDLRSRKPDWRRLSMFWDLSDWARNAWHDPADAGPLFPQVLRQEIGRRYLTLRYRDSARQRLASRLDGEEPESCPILGDELSPWHQQDRSLKGVAEEHFEEYLERTRLNDPIVRENDQAMHDALARLMASCRAAEVPLIVYEVPISGKLRKGLPDGVHSGYIQIVTKLTRAAGVPFFSYDELQAFIGRGGFREHSHLNHKGAMRFSKIMAERVVVPALKGKLRAPARDERR
jgi:hypothetical protein